TRSRHLARSSEARKRPIRTARGRAQTDFLARAVSSSGASPPRRTFPRRGWRNTPSAGRQKLRAPKVELHLPKSGRTDKERSTPPAARETPRSAKPPRSSSLSPRGAFLESRGGSPRVAETPAETKEQARFRKPQMRDHERVDRLRARSREVTSRTPGPRRRR